MRKPRTPALLLSIALGACGRVGFDTRSDGGGDAGDGGPIAPFAPHWQSGSRIRARVLTATDGGDPQLLGWHDAQLDTDCASTLAAAAGDVRAAGRNRRVTLARARSCDQAPRMDSWISVKTKDGPMRSYLTRPSGRGGPHPGVVVLQEAFGVNAYVKSVCDRLADAGFTALAPELFHRAGTHIDLPYTDMPKVMEQMTKLTNDNLEEDIASAVAELREQKEIDPKRIAVIGFCVGGFAAVLGGLSTAVAAVVAYYPGGLIHARQGMQLQPLVGRMSQMKAATQIHYGAEDKGISAEDRNAAKDALEKSQCVHQIVVHQGAGHGFHSHDREGAYHPEAAEEAWHETLSWLKEQLA